MGALHGPLILQVMEGKDVQLPPLSEGELFHNPFFSVALTVVRAAKVKE